MRRASQNHSGSASSVRSKPRSRNAPSSWAAAGSGPFSAPCCSVRGRSYRTSAWSTRSGPTVRRRPQRTPWRHTSRGSANFSRRTGSTSSDGVADTGSASAGPFSTRGSSRLSWRRPHGPPPTATTPEWRPSRKRHWASGTDRSSPALRCTLVVARRPSASTSFDRERLELRVDPDLALGRHAELVGELRRLVEESPYRERLVAQLMVALYRSGRQAEALEVYERTRRALGDDLGLRPSAELRRLSGEIARQDARLARTNPAEPADSSNGPDRLRRRTVLGALAVTG